jgi:cell division protein FtsQ
MPQRINKKILTYFFLFIFCGTLNNKYLRELEIPKIKSIEVIGLDEQNNIRLSQKLNFLKMQNLLNLDHSKIKGIINSNYLIEKYFITKKYPYSLRLEIIQTKFLANLNKNGKLYFLGSNQRLIETQKSIMGIPFIFGNLEIKEFFKLKLMIDNSAFDFNEIKNLFFFPSGRWDIETYSGLLIKLPKDNVNQSINLFLKIRNEDGIENKKMIDLRQKNQLIINEK